MHFAESNSCIKTIESKVIWETSGILIYPWMELSRNFKTLRDFMSVITISSFI